jgi:hypothetical protein
MGSACVEVHYNIADRDRTRFQIQIADRNAERFDGNKRCQINRRVTTAMCCVEGFALGALL